MLNTLKWVENQIFPQNFKNDQTKKSVNGPKFDTNAFNPLFTAKIFLLNSSVDIFGQGFTELLELLIFIEFFTLGHFRSECERGVINFR